jgi:hypothetical protein
VFDQLGIYGHLSGTAQSGGPDQVLATYDEDAANYVIADARPDKGIMLEEFDGEPSLEDVTKITVPNCTLRSDGDGAGGKGRGARLTFNKVTAGSDSLEDITKFVFPSSWSVEGGQDNCTAVLDMPYPFTPTGGGTCLEFVSLNVPTLVYQTPLPASISDGSNEFNSDSNGDGWVSMSRQSGDRTSNVEFDPFWAFPLTSVGPTDPFLLIIKEGWYFIIVWWEVIPNDGLKDITDNANDIMGENYRTSTDPACPGSPLCAHSHRIPSTATGNIRGFGTVAYNAKLIIDRTGGTATQHIVDYLDLRYLNPFESIRYTSESHDVFSSGRASAQNPFSLRGHLSIIAAGEGPEMDTSVGAVLQNMRVTIIRFCPG